MSNISVGKNPKQILNTVKIMHCLIQSIMYFNVE